MKNLLLGLIMTPILASANTISSNTTTNIRVEEQNGNKYVCWNNDTQLGSIYTTEKVDGKLKVRWLRENNDRIFESIAEAKAAILKDCKDRTP